MTFSNQAIIMPPLEQQLWDKTLNVPLAGGFVNFYEDANRTIPKVVYELTGTGPGSYTYVSLGSTLTLSGIGTYIDSSGGNIPIYLWPYTGTPNDNPLSQTAQNYYITVYSSTGVFQFDISNWPGVSSGNQPSENSFNTTDNIISNSQFVDVSFSTAATQANPVVFNTSGTNFVTQIAPDWAVITTGAGNFSVWQVPIYDDTASYSPSIGNPAYALGITSSTYMSPIQLRQRIYSPRILAGRYVSGTFIAETTNGAYTITMNYTPSITGTIQEVCSGMSSNSGFAIIANDPPIEIGDPGSGTGYVDISIVIPVGAALIISCIQLCGVATDTEVVSYLEETPEREIDHLFHYFQPQLNFKPIASLLTGWDFPLNPAQFPGGTTQTVGTTASYIWDQTIMGSATGDISVVQTNFTGGMLLTNANGAEAFYMLQYLSGGEALQTILSRLSINIMAYSLYNTNVIVTPYLFVAPVSANVIPTIPTTIGTIANTGLFTLTAGAVSKNWVAIPNQYSALPQTTIPIAAVDTQFSGFGGFQGSFSTSGVVFAIVIAFKVPTISTNIVIDSISLVPGDIPTRPAPQTASEVLRECQYYYETSDPDAAGIIFPMNTLVTGGSAYAFATPFEVNYQQVKRTAPSFDVTSLLGVSAKYTVVIYYYTGAAIAGTAPVDIATTVWGVFDSGTTRIAFIPASAGALNSTLNSGNYSSAQIGFNYIADARLGVV